MASPFANLSKMLAKGMKGQFGKGTLLRETSDALDDFGDPVPGTQVTYPFEGIKDSFSAMDAALSGIPLTDVRILIINQLTSASKPISQDDKLLIGPPDGSAPAQWHAIRKILSIDPAGATTTVQAYVINDPTETA